MGLEGVSVIFRRFDIEEWVNSDCRLTLSILVIRSRESAQTS